MSSFSRFFSALVIPSAVFAFFFSIFRSSFSLCVSPDDAAIAAIDPTDTSRDIVPSVPADMTVALSSSSSFQTVAPAAVFLAVAAAMAEVVAAVVVVVGRGVKCGKICRPPSGDDASCP